MNILKNFIWAILHWILSRFFPKVLVSYVFKRTFHRSMNWKNPRDLNEKINWLKFNSDTTEWTRLADKYAVREYVKEKGFEDILVPLYGKWDKAEDIDWDSLPEQFVMKTNHGSGDALICFDKQKIDRAKVTKEFSTLLTKKFGYKLGEPHYNNIKPCIIAEQLLDSSKQQIKSSSPIDYKIWCFNGKAEYIWACYDRTKDSVMVGTYDLDWNFHPEYSVSTHHYILADMPIPRPLSLDRMIEAACKLSEGYPLVRIDFYEIDGKPYFGEMTFTSNGGYNDFYTQEFLDLLGSKCKL